MKKKLNNGIFMPLIGFGTVGLKGKEGEQIILNALSVGYRMIDTAQMYDNEKEVGRAIIHSGIPRHEIFITTKLCRRSHSYQQAKQDIELSLQNLQTDYIDLCLVHEPYEYSLDIYHALEDAYREGKIKAIGISNFNQRRLKEFLPHCQIIPAVNQIESHIFYQQLELKKYMDSIGIVTEAWASFAGGNKIIHEQIILKEIGNKYHKTEHQIALKYLIQNEIIVIPRSTHIQRMKENLELFDFMLDQNDMESIRLLDEKHTLYNWMKEWE